MAEHSTETSPATSKSKLADDDKNGKESAIIIGAGPGLGAALAHRFQQGGFNIGIVARTKETLDPLERSLRQRQSGGRKVLAIPADAGNEGILRDALDRFSKELGDIAVLVYNAGAYAPGGVLELAPSRLLELFAVGAVGLLTAAQTVVPAMLRKRRGTILVSGATASIRGGARFAGLSAPKFALRSLAQSMARELHPQGIHVAHVVIDGQIATPRQVEADRNRNIMTFLDPAAIAETYWHLHTQHPSTWTHEVDLRPKGEKF